MHPPLALALLLALLLGGCDPRSPRCTRSEQCGPGEVCADGICAPLFPLDQGTPDRGSEAGATEAGPDRGPEPDRGGRDGGACVPNQNGVLERGELPLTVPGSLAVVRGGDLVLDLQGGGTPGARRWDLSKAAANDKNETMKVLAVPGWAAGSFPGASYASRLMEGYGLWVKVDLLGVFRLSQRALSLQGAISDKANHTRMVYSAPLDTLRFPVTVGQSFSSEATVAGTTDYAVAVWLRERYTVDVLDRGQLTLGPTFTLPALLVRLRQSAYPLANPLLKSTTTAFLFLAECYGTVAHVVAKSDPGQNLASVQVKERWTLALP